MVLLIWWVYFHEETMVDWRHIPWKLIIQLITGIDWTGTYDRSSACGSMGMAIIDLNGRACSIELYGAKLY